MSSITSLRPIATATPGTRPSPFRWAARLAVASLAAASLLVLVAVAPAEAHDQADRPELQCGVLPTTNVVLTHDLTCETGFHFGPADTPVSIDLGGHTLTVPGDAGACTAPGPCGAIAGARAVRNGGVVGTLSDIGDIGLVAVFGDVELRLGFAGRGGPAAIHHSWVLDGTVKVWGSSVSVTKNIIRGGIDLVSTNSAIRDLLIADNWVLHSPRAGIAVNPQLGNFPGDIDGAISRNVVVAAAGPGIDLGGGLWNIGDLTIDKNWLVANGGSGFRSQTSATGPPVVAGGPVTLSGNVAVFNGGHGIEAGWMSSVAGTGIVDGGGNHAGANGASPACIGVAC